MSSARGARTSEREMRNGKSGRSGRRGREGRGEGDEDVVWRRGVELGKGRWAEIMSLLSKNGWKLLRSF